MLEGMLTIFCSQDSKIEYDLIIWRYAVSKITFLVINRHFKKKISLQVDYRRSPVGIYACAPLFSQLKTTCFRDVIRLIPSLFRPEFGNKYWTRNFLGSHRTSTTILPRASQAQYHWPIVAVGVVLEDTSKKHNSSSFYQFHRKDRGTSDKPRDGKSFDRSQRHTALQVAGTSLTSEER